MLRVTTIVLLFLSAASSILMNCYLNGGIILPSNAVLYNNVTFENCQCYSSQQNLSGFQYNNSAQSCYTFAGYPSLSDIQVIIDSQICFIHQTAMV